VGDIVRRGTKDRPRFYVRYVDADGRRKQRAVKGAVTKAEAQKVLSAVETRIANGKVGIEEPTPEEMARNTITVKALGERFAKEYSSPKLKDPKRYHQEASNILALRVYPHLGDHAAAAVTALEVEQMRDKLTAEGYAARSVTLALATLSKVYNWGRKVCAIDCPNPVKGCERPRAQSSIDYLSHEEVVKLFTWSEERAPYLHPMIATGIYAGMRKGELFGLRWLDVHLDMARIDVMHSYRLLPKSGKPRHVPMHPELVRILRAWKERCPATAEGLVFPVGGGMGDRFDSCGLAEVMDAAGCHVPDKPWHALRHTFASHFMMERGQHPDPPEAPGALVRSGDDDLRPPGARLHGGRGGAHELRARAGGGRHRPRGKPAAPAPPPKMDSRWTHRATETKKAPKRRLILQ
jgi:integrase